MYLFPLYLFHTFPLFLLYNQSGCYTMTAPLLHNALAAERVEMDLSHTKKRGKSLGQSCT